MLSAFGEPPDSGVKVSASAEGATSRSASSVAASATSSRRRGTGCKARGSYLRTPEALHFVAVAPRGSGVHFELLHAQPIDLELVDVHVHDRRPAHHQPADGEGADRH